MKQTIELEIPQQLTLLCELLEITPQQILQGFVNDLSYEVHGSNGSDERRMAGEYFLRVGYGMDGYEWEQVEQMLLELDNLRKEWPGNSAEKEKEYQQTCRKYLDNWFKEWKAAKKDSV